MSSQLFGSEVPSKEHLTRSGGAAGEVRDLRRDTERAFSKIQSGTATLVAGTKTVTGVSLTTSSRIQVTRNTPGGSVGNLSAPQASRNVTMSQFVVNSDDAGETSTFDWLITS